MGICTNLWLFHFWELALSYNRVLLIRSWINVNPLIVDRNGNGYSNLSKEMISLLPILSPEKIFPFQQCVKSFFFCRNQFISFRNMLGRIFRRSRGTLNSSRPQRAEQIHWSGNSINMPVAVPNSTKKKCQNIFIQHHAHLNAYKWSVCKSMELWRATTRFWPLVQRGAVVQAHSKFAHH